MQVYVGSTTAVELSAHDNNPTFAENSLGVASISAFRPFAGVGTCELEIFEWRHPMRTMRCGIEIGNYHVNQILEVFQLNCVFHCRQFWINSARIIWTRSGCVGQSV